MCPLPRQVRKEQKRQVQQQKQQIQEQKQQKRWLQQRQA